MEPGAVWASPRVWAGQTFTNLGRGKANKKAEEIGVEAHEVQVWHDYCPSLESHKIGNVPPVQLPGRGCWCEVFLNPFQGSVA